MIQHVIGCLWVAHWGGSCVSQYSSSAKLLNRLIMPCSQPTCVAFGGAELDTLYVTSSRLAGVDTDSDGCVFAIYNIGSRGLPESRFILNE